ncbi:MAG: hypothetical protein ACOC70_01405 [bacterium]
MRLFFVLAAMVGVLVCVQPCLARGKLTARESRQGRRLGRKRAADRDVPEEPKRAESAVKAESAQDAEPEVEPKSGKLTGQKLPSRRLHANLAERLRKELKAEKKKVGEELTAVTEEEEARARAEEEEARRKRRRRRRKYLVTWFFGW